MSKLEVLITGSSRPQLWPYFWESFKKMCIMRDDPKIIVHEDQVFPGQTAEVVKYCERLKRNQAIDEFDLDAPAIGLGTTIERYLRSSRLNGKYTFYIQEDWEFERPIDIDHITWTMDRHDDINLIFFNKIKNNGSINRQKQEQVDYDGYPYCVYHSWTMLPGIWRTGWVRKHWPRNCTHKPEGAMTRQFGLHDHRTSVEYCRENIGAYIYGRTGEFRYIRHLGNDWRMASWQLEGDRQNRPGGNHNSKTMDLDYMAPWVPYPERPTQKGDRAND